MRRKLLYCLPCIIFVLVVLLLIQYSSASAQENADLVARGKYLTSVAGCIGCHTPLKAEFNVDPTKLTLDQVRTLALSGNQALDMTKAFSGGRAFDLGPAGTLYSRNLTSDKETGLGNWSDADIETVLRYGRRSDGSRLHPIMPYRNFTNMSTNDMKAVIAFLRSLPPIKNAIPRRNNPNDQFPDVAPSGPLAQDAPTASDPLARGSYLVNTILSCSDCHTPLDQTTGAPLTNLKMAGGQPFEGPWGIVYSGNITPHKDNGIGSWTIEQVKNAVTAGVDKTGRRLIVMPWEDYSNLTQDDANAVATYLLQGLQPIDNKVPANSIQDPFIQTTPVAQTASPNTGLLIGGGIVLVLLVLGGIFVSASRRPKPKTGA